MGYIAKKSQGHISKSVIHKALEVMDGLALDKATQVAAKKYFNTGKTITHIDAALINLRKACRYKLPLLRLFVDIQYEVAQVDGLSQTKIILLNEILQGLGFAPLNQQYHFYENYGYQKTYDRQRGSRGYTGARSTIPEAYTLLGLGAQATKQDVKRAYRRLMSIHHPDKLIAKGASQEEIQKATNRTQAIRKAYEEILQAKGW